MSYENRPGTGALFQNAKKTEGDNRPDFRGPFYEVINGETVEREIAAWQRKDKNGKVYLSLKVGDKFVPSSAKDDGPAYDK